MKKLSDGQRRKEVLNDSSSRLAHSICEVSDSAMPLPFVLFCLGVSLWVFLFLVRSGFFVLFLYIFLALPYSFIYA